MTKEWPGYPLPPGELGQDEIVCQLVYLPNRDEYWQAFYGALGYMATWLAWERDDGHRGKDAASDWRKALELTTECWRMACLEEITERLDILIDLFGSQENCCGNTTIGPVTTVITNITPGQGDDPVEWGETEVADWDEWSEYVCYHAHVYVDSLINSAKAIDLAIGLGSFSIDFFVGVMQFLQFLGLDQMLGLNQVWLVYEAFRAEEDMSGWFTPLADKFEAARQDIVCSIIQGGSLSDAVEDAIDDNVVWLLFYVLTDYAAVQALIYEGTADGVEYLAPTKRDDCDTCEFEQETNETVFVEWVQGESPGYDAGEDEWRISGKGVTGCRNVTFRLWETASKLVEKPCIVVVTSCDGGLQCASLDTDLGILDTVEQYSFVHPPLAGLELGPVDFYRHLHVAVTQYTMTFKLYS